MKIKLLEEWVKNDNEIYEPNTLLEFSDEIFSKLFHSGIEFKIITNDLSDLKLIAKLKNSLQPES